MENQIAGNQLIALPSEMAPVEKWKKLELFVEEVCAYRDENAVDKLLRISRQMKYHREMHYAGFRSSKEDIRRFYLEDLSRRISFAGKNMAGIFVLGQQQHLFRRDISAEMVKRYYAKRVLDLHNPKIFPPEKLSHRLISLYMFESVIRSLSTPDGLKYFEKIVS